MRIQRLRRLRHEPHAGERNDVAFEIAGPAREFQAIAHHIGKRLDLGLLVMVRQQNSAAFPFQVENFFGNCSGGEHGSAGISL